MIHIKNRQRKITLDVESMRQDLQILLDALNYHDFDIAVLITTNKTIQAYNNSYRKKDVPTDILSFPYHPELKPGKRIKVHDEDDKNLGDLIIAAEYMSADAYKLGVTVQAHMKKLLVHGVCHLLGYDHIIDADWRSMRAKEAFLLKKISPHQP